MNEYEKWLSTCTSYEDVSKWLEENFVYDNSLLLERIANTQKAVKEKNVNFRLEISSPDKIFITRKGMCFESSWFAERSLNRINSEYRSNVIFILIEKYKAGHMVCGFYINKNLHVMDYGDKVLSLKGTFGPFADVDDYVNNFFLKNHPVFKTAEQCHFGWPSYFVKEL